MKPPVNYYGGKQQMSLEILHLLNKVKHRGFAEVFAGSAAVFFAKQPSAYEVLNDKNGNVANFYRMMQTRFDQLHDMVIGTLHDEYTHKMATVIYKHPENENSLDRAWAFWVVCNLSWGASPGNDFQYVKNKNDNWTPATRVKNKREFFQHYQKRLQKVTVLNKDAIEVIRICDHKDIVFYCDPPYVGANQGHYGGYSQEQFTELLDTLANIEGKFILSSYPNEALSEYVERCGWNSHHHNRRLSVMGTEARKTEVLTFNFPHIEHAQLSWL